MHGRQLDPRDGGHGRGGRSGGQKPNCDGLGEPFWDSHPQHYGTPQKISKDWGPVRGDVTNRIWCEFARRAGEAGVE